MKYIANPVEADAFKIVEFIAGTDECPAFVKLDDGRLIAVTRAMLSRMTPAPGDYYVRQDDGYVYLNPAHVFEHKYSPAPAPTHRSE